MNYSGGKLAETLVHVDLTKTAPSFPIPWYVIHGSEDLNTPVGPARAYFDAMKAPRKQFAVIEGAGHFALATHSQEFIRLMKAMLVRAGVPERVAMRAATRRAACSIGATSSAMATCGMPRHGWRTVPTP